MAWNPNRLPMTADQAEECWYRTGEPDSFAAAAMNLNVAGFRLSLPPRDAEDPSMVDTIREFGGILPEDFDE